MIHSHKERAIIARKRAVFRRKDRERLEKECSVVQAVKKEVTKRICQMLNFIVIHKVIWSKNVLI
jgi:hypothetical protein